METKVYELARLTQEDVEQTPLTTRAYMARHRNAILLALSHSGFEEIKFTRYSAKQPHRPEITAVREGHAACVCFAPIPAEPLDLDGLSEEQCRLCDAEYSSHDVYYACLLMNPEARALHLIGPMPVKQDGIWQLLDPEQSQYLPLSMLKDVDRYSPIFGGATLFKLDKLLIPHVLEHGLLPRFSVENLFHNAVQGEGPYCAVMRGDAPTHLMLLEQQKGKKPRFRRPFFYSSDNPKAELELTRCMDSPPECGVIELLDRTGRVIYAECLETVIFPSKLITGKHYMWTLSLVANRLRVFKSAGGSAAEPALYQEPYDSCTQLCGSVTSVERVYVNGMRVYRWTLCPLQHNESVEVQVYVGDPLMSACHRPPVTVGEVVEVEGFMYASPDRLVETQESWQDSGEVAVMQESNELETMGKLAHRVHAPYSLAHAVVASAFVGAGYEDMTLRSDHTRSSFSFAMSKEDDEKDVALLFVDVQIGDTPSQFSYSDEQIREVTKREGDIMGVTPHAHHCFVRLERKGENFAAAMRIEPPCPGVPPVIESLESLVPPDEEMKDEALACRILGTAICRQTWGGFAAIAHEDMSYSSLVNGVKLVGKMEYIRYMSERKLLWINQQAWSGVSIDTGTVEYVGVRRPCFMMSCYGRMVGAAVVTLHEGRVSNVMTLPLEVNESFVKDAECAAEPRIFDPMRGHMDAYAEAPSPLQRFAIAYMQECMIRKLGFCGATGSQETTYVSDGKTYELAKEGARWAKMLNYTPSFCDMAFTCAGRTYAVCAVEVDAHPEHGGNIADIIRRLPAREKLLRLAEQHRLIPCIFPVERDHTPNPNHTWNLWDLRTSEHVTPTLRTGEEEAPVSEWEVLCAALGEVVHYLTVSGCEVVACHDAPDLLPHVWFRDHHGQISWIAIRPHTSVAHADRGTSEDELLAMRLTPGVPCFVIDAEPYQDAAFTKPAATRDSMRFAKITMPLPLN